VIFWSVACGVLGLAFAAEAAGLFAHPLNTLLAVALLALGALLDPTTGSGDRRAHRRLQWMGWAAAAVGLLLVPAHVTVRLFAVALWFVGLDTVAVARQGRHGPAAAMALGALALGLVHLLSGTSLLTWYLMQSLSRLASGVAVEISGESLAMGPTFSNLALFVGALGVCVGGWLVAGRRRIVWFAGCLVVIIALYGACLWVFAMAPRWVPQDDALAAVSAETAQRAEAAPWWLSWLAGRAYPLHVPMLLPVLLAVPLGLYLWRMRRDSDAVAVGSRPAYALAVMAAVLVGAAALTNAPGTPRAETLHVAFYEGGLVNWMTPSPRMYGSRSGGMFGNLPLMMERMGWTGELIGELNRDTLAGKDILFIANQKDALSGGAIAAVEDFVEKGGSLLVMGDHTFWKGEKRLVLNEPIQRSDIRFVFDSADYFVGGWLHSLAFWQHPVTAGLSDHTNESGSVVGASLDIRYPAAPLVIGRYGYSDPGEPANEHRGYLGNMDYDPGEPLGDRVLVAAQQVGRGRVAVIGDTSAFFNSIHTQTWRYTHRLFHWLGTDGRAAVSGWRDVLGILLLAGAVGVAFVFVRRQPGLVPVVATACLAFGFASHHVVAEGRTPPPLKGDIAIVDLSHVGQHSMEGWRDRGIGGVYLNLMREGFFAVGARRFDPEQILASELFVSIAPTQPYSDDEVEVLRRFMERGGTVLLCAGWEDRHGALPLLEKAGLSIEHIPLGRQAATVPGTTIEPMLWKAWPIRGGEALLTLNDLPVVVQQPIGRGRLVVIGDSEFVLNRNLEGEDGGVMRNIQFFTWLINTVMERTAT